MAQYEAILFDCDGVLIDSEPLGLAALETTIRDAGLNVSAKEVADALCGASHADSLDWMAQNGLEAEALFAEADRRLFAEFAKDVPLIPGVERVLEGIALPMAVCSNSRLVRLEQSLHRTAIARLFNGHIYSGEQVAFAKPAPDLALFALGKLGGLAPERAIFIDDNRHGMACAKAVGCLAIGFIGPSEHRIGHEDTLWAAGADHVVRGMAELDALLGDLLRAKAA